MANEHHAEIKAFGDIAARYPLLTAEEEITLGRQVQAWQRHPDGPDGCPPLVRRRGLRARDRMVRANLRLVVNCVRRNGQALAPELPTADLLQAAALALVRGAELFDPERGYKFSTYIFWWLRKGLTDSARQPGGRAVHVPPGVIRDLRQMRGNTAPLREHTPGRLAAGALALRCGSLDVPLKHTDAQRQTLLDVVADQTPAPDPADTAAAAEAMAELRRQADPDLLAALELLAEGERPAQVAAAAGMSTRALGFSTRALRKQLRRLPAVAEVLGVAS